MKLQWTSRAIEDLEKLSHNVSDRITGKMDWFSSQEDPLSFSKRLVGNFIAYRFRLGDYRIICTLDKGVFNVLSVLSVKHHKDVYRS